MVMLYEQFSSKIILFFLKCSWRLSQRAFLIGNVGMDRGRGILLRWGPFKEVIFAILLQLNTITKICVFPGYYLNSFLFPEPHCQFTERQNGLLSNDKVYFILHFGIFHFLWWVIFLSVRKHLIIQYLSKLGPTMDKSSLMRLMIKFFIPMLNGWCRRCF